MIIPRSVEEKLETQPDLKSLVQSFPYHFFGYFIRYPKQAEIIKTWLRVKPKITVIRGWKRTSKTNSAAFLATCWAMKEFNHLWLCARAMGIDKDYYWRKSVSGWRTGIIAGHSLDHVENVLLPMYQSMLPPGHVKSWFSRTNKRIELTQKTKFLIRTYEQSIEEWKSGVCQFAHLDEEPPLEVMLELLERCRTVEGKIIISVALDDADVSWLPDACKNPKRVFGTDSLLEFQLGVEDVPNEIYPESEKLIVYNQYDPTPLRNAVRKGDWAFTSSRWWNRFSPEINIVPYFKPPAHWLRWRFIDAGYAAPTACAWVAMHPDGDIFIYREYYQKEKTIDERCKEIIEASGNLRQKEYDYFVEKEAGERYVFTQLDFHEFKIDPNTGDNLSQLYIQAGLIVSPSTTLGQEERREIVNRWLMPDMKKKHFVTHKPGAPRLYIMDNCVNLIYEAQTKIVKRESSSRSPISEKKVVHRGDHLTDVTEYACAALEFWVDDAKLKS